MSDITITKGKGNRHIRRKIVKVAENIPMVGIRAFGIVDMGTNIVEVRPTSLCPLSCIFCSVNAGPNSSIRWCEYVVDLDIIVDAVAQIVKYKECDNIEIHIDGMGEPGTYPKLIELVDRLRELDEVRVISMQTRLVTFNERKIEEISEVGLDRFNVSIDAIDCELARKLSGTSWYNVERVLELVKYAVENTRSDVVLTPVWLPGINDHEIERIIQWAIENKLGKRWPPILIQKYIPHKHGRKIRVREMSWREFYNRLRLLEKKYNIKLIPSLEDFQIRRTKKLPLTYKHNDIIKVKVIERGIFLNEYIAVPLTLTGSHVYDRLITVIADSKLEHILMNQKLKVRIIENKNNIYIARPIEL